MTVEIGIRHIQVIDVEVGTFYFFVWGVLGFSHQCNGLCRLAELCIREVLQMTCHFLRTSVQLGLNGAGSTVGLMAFADTLISHELAHRLYLCQQFVDNITSDGRLEDTSANNAESIDETATEIFAC